MVDCMSIFFNKNSVSNDIVELSIGTVRFYELNYGIIRKALTFATIKGSLINNEMYYAMILKHILPISPSTVNKLSVEDGIKLKNKLIEILKRHGLAEEETISSIDKTFNKNDVEWFDKTKINQMRNIDGNFRKG
jgi:hypothetical protein